MPPNWRLAACLAPAVIGLGILLWAAPIATDYDLFWHLRSGRWMLENGRLLTRDVFSYLSAGEPDEAMFAWAAQVLFALTHRLGGMAALLALNFLLIAGAMALMARHVWRETGSPFLTGVGATVFLLLHAEKQQLRPALFGELFFCVAMFLLLAEARPLGKRRLAALAALMVAWHQFHSSALVLAPIGALYGLSFALSARTPDTLLSRLRPAIVPLIVAGSVLAQPAGLGALWRAWGIAPLARALGIGEWTAFRPWAEHTISSYLILAGAPALFFLLRRERCSWTRAYPFLVSILLLVLPLQARRHRFFLVYPAALILVEIGRALRSRAGVMPSSARGRAGGWVSLGGTALASALLCTAFPFWRHAGAIIGVDKAADFIAAASLRGNLSAFPFCAGYFLFRSYPQVRTGLDGRLQTHRSYFRMLASNFAGQVFSGPRLIVTPDTDLLLERTTAGFMQAYADPKQWVVIFENSQASIALRRNERNRENLKRVEGYYRARRIPFDPARGFQPAEAYRANPAWYRQAQDRPISGRWPTDATADAIEDWENTYARLRRVPVSPTRANAFDGLAAAWDTGSHEGKEESGKGAQVRPVPTRAPQAALRPRRPAGHEGGRAG